MGTIIKIAKTIVKTADRITMHATNGDICLNAAKSVNFSSKDKIEFGNYNPPELENTDKLLVTKVEGPDTIALGKKQDFKATRFSRPVADPRELEKVKWAYQLDDEKIVKLDTPGGIIGKTVVKKIDTPNSWKKHKTLKVYAYIESPSEKVSVECKIKEALIHVTTSKGRFLFSLKPNSMYEAQTITAKELYNKGIQWFCPYADNYLKLVEQDNALHKFSELKHFSWD
ncbi:MAG: hypothetical protein OIF50_01705 [Flavobacteriaceae bacterium]|nr:hypothetical protein [Flavobacteriaceae bacterium]